MRFAFFVIVGVGVVLGGAIVLQVFLSRKENKWLGLILPMLAVMLSVIPVLNVAVITDTATHPRDEIIDIQQSDTATVYPPDDGSGMVTETRTVPGSVTTIVLVFFLANIPTVILLIIYLACRERFNRRRAIERMRLQDLQ
jgi:hypothetical protein